MSEFEIWELPGGEVKIGRTLTESEDGVNDHSQFMLREDEQKELIRWLLENRESEIMQLISNRGEQE